MRSPLTAFVALLLSSAVLMAQPISDTVSKSCPINFFGGRMTAPVMMASKRHMTEAVELSKDAGEQGLLHSAIWLRKMIAVSWVDQTEIEYADGSTWTLRISLNAKRFQINLCRSLAQ